MKHRVLVGGSLLLTTFFFLFWWYSPFLAYIDYKIYDRITHTFPSSHHPDSTIVVEIDDKSLKALGQWPWPRMITAKLIETINHSSPSAIILDTVFSEEDRTSPVVLETFYRERLGIKAFVRGIPVPLRDNDSILSSVMRQSPMVMPVFSNTAMQSGVCRLPMNISYDPALKGQALYEVGELVCSLSRFQQQTHGVGHIHAEADSDGIVRRLALVMRHQEIWIPTLGISALASPPTKVHFEPIPPLFGEMRMEIGDRNIVVDQYAEALLNFYPFERYEKISAVDILRGDINPKRLKGKYIFIGSTALGLDSRYTMSDGSVRSGVYIHATMVENLLNDDLMVQPSLYRSLNVAISLLMGLVLLVQMLRKHYLSVVAIFFSVLALAIGVTYWSWYYKLYISIGYLIVPLASYLFVLALLMFFIDYRNKKNFIDALNLSNAQKQHLQSALSQSEREIEYQKAMVIQQSKLAAMGEMIDHIAHQWRQPLNLLGVIVQHAEFIYAKGKMDGAYVRRLSSESMEQILFMSQTIEDFRNFVKPDRKNIPFDLNHPIEESLKLLSGMFSVQGIAVKAHYSDCPLIVMGSPSELKQVIINLLQNGSDALVYHGTDHPSIEVAISSEEGRVAKIEITDNGGGIAEDIIGRIFEPYFTTKEEGKGSGIGLYISDAIIRTKMGGEITALNYENGVTFTIRIPLLSD